jgi:hypothetical protein
MARTPYRYETGHSGDACLTGFAVRGKDLVVYLLAESPAQVELRARLGKHKMGKSCLYFKRLADLDVEVLEALIADRSRMSNAAIRTPPPDHSLNRIRCRRMRRNRSGSSNRIHAKGRQAAAHV